MAPSSFVIPWPVCTTNFPTRLPSTTSSTLSFCLLYIFSLLFKKEGYRKLMTTKDITRYYVFPSPHPRNTYAFSAKGQDKVDFWSITTWLCERKRHAMPRTSNSPLFPRIFLFGFFLHPNKIFKQRKNISRPFSPHFDVVCLYVMCTFKSSVVCKTTVLSFSRDEEMVLEDTPPSFSAFINISQ